jgi:hypothetical protein
VARVIFGLHIRISSHRLCGIHGEGVAVALKQESDCSGGGSWNYTEAAERNVTDRPSALHL